jgi:hypothetical protein
VCRTQVRTGLGLSDRPGSQGGFENRDQSRQRRAGARAQFRARQPHARSTGGDWKRNPTASPRQPPTQPSSRLTSKRDSDRFPVKVSNSTVKVSNGRYVTNVILELHVPLDFVLRVGDTPTRVGPFRPAWPSAPTLSTIPATPRPTPSPTHPNPKSRLPPTYASIHPARSAPLLTIQTVAAVDYVALPHHAI